MKINPNIQKGQGLLKHDTFMSSASFYLKNSMREARRKKLYFCLALTSTLVVVAATAVSQTLIDYAPLIFLKSSEAKAGAIDVSIQPLRATFIDDDYVSNTSVRKYLLFNSTAIESIVRPIFPDAMTSRYSLTSALFNVKKDASCNNATSPPYKNCPSYATTIVFQNTKKEGDLGIGVDLELPSVISPGGIILSKKFADFAHLKRGDTVIIRVDVAELLKELAIEFNSQQQTSTARISQNAFTSAVSYLPFRIEKIADGLSGKFSNDKYDNVVAEYGSFLAFLADNMPSNSPSNNQNYPAFLRFIKNENPQDYANSILFNLEDRIQVYKDSNFDNIQDKVTGFASKISDALGVYPFYMELPVFEELSDLKFGSLFLGIALIIIIVVLFILSTILIYNILLITVETKTFEFGVIRMIGLTKIGISQLILVQALFFAIPGVVIGFGLSIPLLMFVGTALGQSLSVEIPIIPPGSALFWSIFIGIAIPIISSYYPMKAALGKELNLSLDLAHSKTSAVHINIELNSKQIPWLQITFAILSVLFGVAIYIILPLSLLSYDLGLLLGLFFCILMGLLIGLTLLSLNLLSLMQKFVNQVFFFWTTDSFRDLVGKNLVAHKLRNKQTATMYSLALGFVIFILVALNQELDNMAYQQQAKVGALLEVKTDNRLDYKLLEQVIQTSLSDVVENYAWVSHDLATFAIKNGYKDVILTHLGQLYTYNPIIRAVSPSIFQTTKTEYLVVSQGDEITGLDLGQQLYTARGSQSVILGEGYRDQLETSVSIDSSVILKFENGVSTKTEQLRVLAALNSSPTFKISQFPSVTRQDILVSFPTFARLASNLTLGMDDIPIEKLLIKVKGDSTENLAKAFSVFSKLKQTSYPSLRIWDYRDTQSSVENNKSALGLVFKAVEIIVMLLSLFSLVTSMSTNILEQTKEIAVLRAVGIPKLKVNLLYVCEAFILVFSSALFGVIIGTAVAWILSMQRALFTQLPMTFHFPFVDFIIIFIGAIISAFLSAYFPARRVTSLQISKIIRFGG